MLDPIAQTSCPAPYALRVVRGDSIDIKLRLFDACTGRPLVLTGFSGTATIFDSAVLGTPKGALPVTVDQSPAAQATTGVVAITATGAETAQLIDFGSWALVLTDGVSSKTLVAGPWSLGGYSLAQPLFTCSSSAASGACGVPGFEVIGAGCEVLCNGFTELTLPFPQAQCGAC